MRALTYYVAVSLDGLIAAPDGDFSAFLAEGDHMAALFADFPDALPGPARDALGITGTDRFDTVVMGWNTYAVGLPAGLTDPYPHLRSVVFERDPDARRAAVGTPTPVEFTADDPVERVRALKREGAQNDTAGIWLCGGGELAGALLAEIDELVLKANPVVLGAGIRLLGDHPAAAAPAGTAPAGFRLVRSRPFESGVVIAEYSAARR